MKGGREEAQQRKMYSGNTEKLPELLPKLKVSPKSIMT